MEAYREELTLFIEVVLFKVSEHPYYEHYTMSHNDVPEHPCNR